MAAISPGDNQQNSAHGRLPAYPRGAVRSEEDYAELAATGGALLTAVIAVTAVLVESPLPRDAAIGRTVTATMPLHGFNVHVIATPIDDRHWNVRIEDLDSLDAAGVSVSEATRHVGPLAVSVTRQGPGTFAGTVTLPFAGAWTLLASVRSGAFDEAHSTLTLPETTP